MIKCSGNDLFEKDLYKNLFETATDTNQYEVPTKLLELLQDYDYKNLFKYDYEVADEELIKDPLDSKSFFSEHHVFNPFTISRAGLRISDSTDSTITIVNNR